MNLSGARLGSKRFYPEMRTFAVFIQDTLSHGIPGHAGINAIQWCAKFGLGLLEKSAVYQWQNQQRQPSIASAVLLGILLKRSGAKIDVYAPLRAAADGCMAMWTAKIEEGLGSSETDLDDRLTLSKPQSVEISPNPKYAVDVYRQLSWEDRLSAASGLLEAIARDVKYFKMLDDLEVIQALVKEAVVSRGGHAGTLADAADVPVEWVKAILKGDWDYVRSTSDCGLLIGLSDAVKDLDGKTRNNELFAPLMSEELMKAYIKEVRKRAKG